MLSDTGRILVVDDDKAVLFVLKETLLRDGFNVEVVESGEKALELSEKNTYDLALIDLKLKGMNGLELISLLRRKLPDIAIIVLTAHASLDSAVEAMRLGAVDYLFKPCKTEDLRASIQRVQQAGRQKQQQKNLISKMKQLLNQIDEEVDVKIRNDLRLDAGSSIDEKSDKGVSMPLQNRFLQRGSFSVDFLRHIITLDNQVLELSPTEFNILVYLITEAPRVVSSTELFREVQGYLAESWEGGDTVRFHIYRIRQKIKKINNHNNVVLTIRGVGYSINEHMIHS